MSLQPDVIEAPQAAQMVVAEPRAVAVTPMAMLQLAFERGATVEQLAQLMAMQERWEANEARKAYTQAFTQFKSAPPAILKNAHVSFGKTQYSHATLDAVCDAIIPALSAVGISHRWEYEQPDVKTMRVTCILTHALGHSERNPMSGPVDESGSKNPIQAIGSTTHYLERYSLLGAVGLTTKGADDDGRGGAGVHEMDERGKADFLAQIAVLADRKAAEVLWQHIAQECTKVGDVAAYAELKAALAAKVKTLGATAKDAI